MPTDEPKAVLSIAYVDAKHPEQGATGVMWIISHEIATGLQEEFLASYGKPVSAMIPGDHVKNLHNDPNLVINDPNQEGEEQKHFLVKMADMPPTEVVCFCGVVFDGDDPLGDLKSHMEAEN